MSGTVERAGVHWFFVPIVAFTACNGRARPHELMGTGPVEHGREASSKSPAASAFEPSLSATSAPAGASTPPDSTSFCRKRSPPMMKKERLPAFELNWSLTCKGQRGLLSYEVTAFEELYVSDRLWDLAFGRLVHPEDPLDGRRERIVIHDPYGVYRFVHDGGLRLVFAPSPERPLAQVADNYAPLYSRIKARETYRNTVEFDLPVIEYSALARDVDSPSVVELVSEVSLVFYYGLRSHLETAPFRPMGWGSVGYEVGDPQELFVSTMQVDALPVRRRTGEIARFTLPGD